MPRRLRGGHQEGLPASLAMKFHPDRNPGDQEAGGEVQGGQGGLRDPHRRAEARAPTTSFGHAGVDPRMPGGGGGGGRGRSGDGFADAFGDIFGDIFGGGGGGGRSQVFRGADLRYNLETHARAGGARHRDRDPRADARGLRDLPRQRAPSRARSPKTCDDLRRRRRRCACQQGFFSIQQTCPTCRGSGKVITEPVRAVPRRRAGTRKHKTLSVKIPAGVDDGRPHPARRARARPGVNGGPAGRPLRRGAA
ncbi:MAG: hypothetical protein MZW92_01925 [Comamonadaceae bacterium]|nr:hypothetical protein [Comamonadaceae bacterium]